ncbi:MAG: TIGR00159 family protein [Candidatus Marinimicrobia bacterium]|nr:TIGR00159 family protein [Candidatus Neomarinimicrobiota bacterium]
MELFKVGFLTVTIVDVLDVLVVAFIFYKLYQALSGTRAAQMMVGLAGILMVSVIVQFLNMSGMAWLIESIRTVWVIAFVILFQPELRRILLALGQSRLARKLFQVEGLRAIDTVIETVFELSKKRYGGLIVIQRDAGLKSIIEKGVRLNARATSELLVSIFNPQSPLHDGAVVILGETIEAAKCILPLSDNPTIDRRMGTRHLAALGLSEESDAVVVVVSEETGRVALAHKSVFQRGLDESALRGLLNKLLLPSS